MISFKQLGNYGRLGNQLFQYAFLRTTAKRLGVSFYCPAWGGDNIFTLDDAGERAVICRDINKEYAESKNNCGFNQRALDVEDGTDIKGYFQSEKYFKSEDAGRWFSFKAEAVAEVKGKYKHIDFSNSTGMHLRFGDMKNNLMYVNLRADYYRKALSKIRHDKHVLVFSDEINQARKQLNEIDREFIYIDGNKDYEDLYLMTQCRDFICSVSTLSWWGGWLNQYPDKIIVAPKEWIRPGHSIKNQGLFCPDWITIKTCRFLWDDYRFLRFVSVWRERFLNARSRSFRNNVMSLKHYLINKCNK